MLKTKMLAALVGLALSVSAMGSAEAAGGGGKCSEPSPQPGICSALPTDSYGLLPTNVDSYSIYFSPYDGNQMVSFATRGRNYYKYLWASSTLIVSGAFGDANTSAWGMVSGNFDTRTVYTDNNQMVESITTDRGQYYKFSLYPVRALLSASSLSSGRWITSNGPCVGVSLCRFDTRAVYNSIYDNNQLIEFITVGTKYWKYNLSTLQLIATGTNASVSRWSRNGNGPCAAQMSGCVIDQRTVFTDIDGLQYETIVVANDWWRYRLADEVLTQFGIYANRKCGGSNPPC